MTVKQNLALREFIALLGAAALAVVLCFHNITDGDLWAKLAIGSNLWNSGHILRHDIYAFTPVLPQYIDHEWGAGVIFYALVKWFGASSLILLRIFLALGLLGLAYATGRKQNADDNALLLLALPAGACLLTGYIPVARSHVFTFFFFAATLYFLEQMRSGVRWPAFALPLMILIWANAHGGFVAGLGIICVYAGWAVMTRAHAKAFVITAAACFAITFINPYGTDFWRYLIPALLHPRARILEWRPLQPFVWDDFLGFRVLSVIAIAGVAVGWKSVKQKNWPGLATLALTLAMGWRSRRHGPFLAASALAFAGPYCKALLPRRMNPVAVAILSYSGIFLWIVCKDWAGASTYPLSPIGEDPVREADILAKAGAKGNAATPFAWGSYVSWRLFPNIKVSMDGRYETTYPESTFDLNNTFYDHRPGWLRLCQDFKVDYVILDLQSEPLRPAQVEEAGYVLITNVANVSALLCLPEHAAALQKAARELPPTTVDPLDLTAARNQ